MKTREEIQAKIEELEADKVDLLSIETDDQAQIFVLQEQYAMIVAKINVLKWVLE